MVAMGGIVTIHANDVKGLRRGIYAVYCEVAQFRNIATPQ
jgi:hypothetical protein